MLKHIVWLLLPLVASELYAQEIRRVALNGRIVTFEVREGLAIVEGDIILGNAADLEAAARSEANGSTKLRSAVIPLLDAPPLWPNGTIYYTIDPLLPNPKRVTDAIAHWNARTPLKMVARAAERDYVRFTGAPGNCTSYIGVVGGAQNITLDPLCDAGRVIHEIGHAFGLLHEQSRRDRNTWVTVLHENLPPQAYSQMAQAFTGRDVGFYDYGSIMHYSKLTFSVNGKLALETVPPGIPIGQLNGLSAGDIDNISRIYGIIPTATTITTIPEGLPIFVDGIQYTSPRSFSWDSGTTHALSTPNLATNPTARHTFVRWSNGGERQHTFTADPGQTVVAAEFRQDFRFLWSVVEGAGSVTVEPSSPDGYYPSGTPLRIRAQPSAGQRFFSWSSSGLVAYPYGYGEPSLDIELLGNLSLFALFSDKHFTTLESTPPGLLVTVDGLRVRTPFRFQNAPAGEVLTLGVASQNSMSDGASHQFLQWEDGSFETSRPLTFGNVDQTYSARFFTKYYLDFFRVGSGSIDVAPSQTPPYVDADANVELRATPAPGQTVRYWVGDVSGTNTTQPLLMDRPRIAGVVMGTPIPFRVTHAGSYAVNSDIEQVALQVAPLEMVTLFGTNLGPATLAGGQIDGQGRLSTNIANTRVLFDGVPAPIVYASALQTSVVVPAEVAGRTSTTITVERNGQPAGALPVSVAPTFPGLFTYNSSGSGPLAALNQDGSIHSRDRPAEPGSVMVLYATGAGLMDRALTNGEVMGTDLARPLAPVYVRIGREPAAIDYAGSAPFLVNGVLQVNVRIPANLTTGEYPVRIIVGNVSSVPGTTLFVK